MLSADDVRDAFNATALEQDGGEFNWNRVAELLNRKLRKPDRATFLLREQQR